MASAAKANPVASITLKLAFGIFILINFGAFSFQLGYTNGEHTGSRLLDAINLASDIVSIALILTSRNARQLTLKCKPLLVLVALGMISAVWSIDHLQTIKAVRNFLSPCLIILAMSGRFSPAWSFKFLLRIIPLCCLLSAIWVLVFPDVAVHQETDRIQSVHAGLWRGVLSHKQELGPFAGQSLALLIFYRKFAFDSFVARTIAIISSALCLWGSGSATGLVIFIVFVLLLNTTRAIVYSPPATRRTNLWILAAITAAVSLMQYFDLLNSLAPLLGKSADLTGRASFYPYLLSQFRNSGYVLLGSGVGCGQMLTEVIVGTQVGLDNGYVETIFTLGYLGFPAMFAILIWIGISSSRLLLMDTGDRSPLKFLPLPFLLTFLVANLSEGLFMKKDVEAFLLTTIIVIVSQTKVGSDAESLDRTNLAVRFNHVHPARTGISSP